MEIIWLIIKIILYVFLGGLGLFLCVLALILLTPIYYEAYLEKYDGLNYHFKIRTLRWIYAYISLEDGRRDCQVKAFGRAFFKKKAGCNDVQQEPLTSEVSKVTDEEPQITSKKYVQADKSQPSVTEMVFNPFFLPAIKQFFSSGKRLIKYLAPKEWSFELILGKEDHADTGELIAKLSLFYPLYCQHGMISGNYEKKGVWGGFLVEGKFRLWGVLKCILIFLCHKAIRQYLKWILELRREEKDGE